MTQSDSPDGSTGGAFGFVRAGYDRTHAEDLSTSDVNGATVYGRDDETVGTVSDLRFGTDGTLTGAVIDVGGVLGIGVHSVLVPFSQLTVLRPTGGGAVRLHLDMTKDQLEEMPSQSA